MNYKKLKINGLLLLAPDKFVDERGFFMESYNQNTINSITGRNINFVQDNFSYSKKGVLRGVHFQQAPSQQAKLVRVSSGMVYDVAVDLRETSDTYLQWFGVILSSDNLKMLFIPEGFGHGFLTLSNSAKFIYKTSDFYSKKDERCIAWDDKKINIHWPYKEYGIHEPIISEKDQQGENINGN